MTNDLPEEMFRAAKSFEYSAEQLERMIPESANGKPLFPISSPTSLPSIVCAAFATELYLKCLLRIEKNKGELKRGHEYKDLFDELSPASQAKIRQEYDELVASSSDRSPVLEDVQNQNLFDFEEMLAQSGEAFEAYRYYYEPSKNHPDFVGILLLKAVRKVILELRPDFGEIAAVLAAPRQQPALAAQWRT
jgi:hypothetical protein